MMSRSSKSKSTNSSSIYMASNTTTPAFASTTLFSSFFSSTFNFIVRNLLSSVIVSMFLFYAISRCIYARVESRQIYMVSSEYHESNSVVQVLTKCIPKDMLRGGGNACGPLVPRMLDYCAASKLTTGEEGATFENSDQYELHYLLFTIRHGDRSAIHSMPGSLPYENEVDAGGVEEGAEEEAAWSTEATEKAKLKKTGKENQLKSKFDHPVHGSKYLDFRALSYSTRFSSFAIDPLAGSVDINGKSTNKHNSNINSKRSGDGGSSNSEEIGIGVGSTKELELQELLSLMPDALNSTTIFVTPDAKLLPGQLTTRGFMQHIALGTMLASVYERFLTRRVKSLADVYVRSTNYARTLQSAAAFMMGMFPELGGELEPVPIASFVEEGDEVMHGIGLRLSSHVIEKTGEKTFDGRCGVAVQAAKRQKSAFKMTSDATQNLVSLFGEGVHALFVTDLADSSLPHLCHNEPLPCSKSDLGLCLSESQLSGLVAEADSAFCKRFFFFFFFFAFFFSFFFN